MKRRSTIIALLLAFVMTFGAFSVFAATGLPTAETKQAIVDAKVQCVPLIKNEVDVEKIAADLANQTVEGGYKLMTADKLKEKIDNNEKIVIVDTMPESWWTGRHIPGAVCAVVGANNGPKFEILASEKQPLLDAVKSKAGTRKYYWNSKKKAWVTKKPAKKYYKKCNKKGDPFKGKKSKVDVDKSTTIVVYCGFTKCQRSHQGAMFLTKQGFTNVYRFAGGISAWVDANYPIEGKDVE